ncbi:MAG: transposase [Syntrophales bacterium]|jgi:transposase|nr:transposase [Syntrophales bacterium]MDY0044713.1 transposase [Syntrophales bacterium]
MDRSSFEDIVKTENSARRFFIRLCWKNYRRYCIRCHSYDIYRLSGGRLRCHRCGYTFHEFSGRWLKELNISAIEWCHIIKYFAEDLTAREITEHLNLSYPTILKAVTVIRKAILAHLPFQFTNENAHYAHIQEHLTDEKIWKASQMASMSGYAFAVHEEQGHVVIEILPGFIVDESSSSDSEFFRRKKNTCAENYEDYDMIIICNRVTRRRGLLSHATLVKGNQTGFWKFAKEKLMKFRGTCEEKFPLYLKEMEFRYNNRDKDIFELIAGYLCDFAPSIK